MDLRHRQLVGTSEAIREIEVEIECAAHTDAKVLLSGQSGVGKEVVANLIHRESRRRLAPFVAINCAGVPDSLLESELFGHVRGSFTDAHRDKKGLLEQAQGGTVFLDEVGEMTVRMQAVLLRFLESGELQRVGADRMNGVVDVRVIAATNRSLLAQVADGKFREDLYYRLNVIHITIPPLRERMEDVPALLKHFMEAASATHRTPEPVLADATMGHLLAYSWPGNVRELKNVVERLVIRARNGAIPPTDLPKEILEHGTTQRLVPVTVQRTAGAGLYERMTIDGESFWSAVYEPFMDRDLTRDDLRAVVSRGLEHTRGSYKLLLEVFNVAPGDYKRLLSFLRKYQCHMPFQKFRSIAISPERAAMAWQARENERLTAAR
jgi:DNA-binding NtrC family response regulator